MSHQNPIAPSAAPPSDCTPASTPRESAAAPLPKAYDPSAIEQRWAEYWVRECLFEVPEPTAKAPQPTATVPDSASSRSSHASSRPESSPCQDLSFGPESVPYSDLSFRPEPAPSQHLSFRPEPRSGGAEKSASPGQPQTSAPFTLLLPPPNVTGRLHMGHMLNQTEMDILTRWHRMRGETALWVPGTDHAGIATQMMVERQLAAEGTHRKTLGREAFSERVWQWKHQYGSAIAEQMKRLGASVDWSREYFTMDDRLSVAVKEAFVRLYEQGLIYRGAYIVNWDPIQQTAVSDLEVTHEERLGKLYHIRYPFADGPLPDGTDSITIATTRPETMLGDVAVAVNPTDIRYKHLIGKRLELPLSEIAEHPNRTIPIVADDWASPEFGTGAVKVTPAHDPNDFAIGQRHKLQQLTIMDESAHINLPGSPYHGLDRFAARERIVGDLEAAGLLAAVKDHAHAIGISQRSGAVIEPRLSMQWFLAVNKPVPTSTPSELSSRPESIPPEDVSSRPESERSADRVERPASTHQPQTSQSGATSGSGAPFTRSVGGEHTRPSIAQTAIDAVREGHINFTPEMYSKTYFEWMGNIHDWCISRQLWWGHRIPAWHCNACGKITVSRDPVQACSGCGITDIRQETDVLDTWFSSGLLPFTVFGWPGDLTTHNSQLTPDLAAFYPTSLLVTGFDILFFWVARMIMLGTHFMLDVPLASGSPRPLAEAVPFKKVYIHALVRDANREKMSKTKGNVIDPIEIVAKYGTDAVRFTLASQASPGTDIAFSEARTEGYRAFANKIWNAARFLFMNLDRAREAGIAFDLPTSPVVPPTKPVILSEASEPGAPHLASETWVQAGSGALESPTNPGAPSELRSGGSAASSALDEAIPPSTQQPIDSTLDPVAVDHSITGKILSFFAASTPHGEAVLQTGNIDLANQSATSEPHPSASSTQTVSFRPESEPGAPHLASEMWAGAPQPGTPHLASEMWAGAPQPGAPHVASEMWAGAPQPGAPHLASEMWAGAPQPGAPRLASEMWAGAPQPLEARWILTRLSQAAAAVNASLADYRFDEAASHVYQFFWGDLCDWYLEIVKLRLNFDSPAQHAETSAALTTLVHVFESALRLLSPFMPFLTEEIWHALYAGNPPAKSIALTRFPQAADYPTDPAALTAIETLQELITNTRALRKELAVPEKEFTPIRVHAPAQVASVIQANAEFLTRLARVTTVQFADTTLTGAGSRSTSAFDVQVVYERQVDIPAERERLTKELLKLNKTLTANETRLADQTFIGKAPPHIVEGLRKQTDEVRTLRDKAQTALDALA